jgi:hypothetical protein
MAGIRDCWLSYFGLDENEWPDYRRYYCYHILAGPGLTAGAGVAWIKLLAVHDGSERGKSCQSVHRVETGGAAAALAAAVRCLDGHHANDRVRRVLSKVRFIDGDSGMESAPIRATALRCGLETPAKRFVPYLSQDALVHKR